MAKDLITGNLNLFGNAGQFEADRSTWGFSDASAVSVRSAVQASGGLYSALVTKPTASGNTILIPYRFAGTVGKFYIIKAKVFVPSGNPVGDDEAELTFQASLDNLMFGLTEIEHVNKTVLEATDEWVQVEISVEASSSPFTTYFEGYLRIAGVTNNNGQVYVDQLEVYEYVLVPDLDPVCDVDIDEEETVVTNESAPAAADGSIDMEATTGTGTLEYSKDGDTWQLATLFAGLTRAIYLMSARRTDLESCLHVYPFAVNLAAVTHDFTAMITHESFSGLHDGEMSLNVTGTGGPFQYSKDAGVTWQAGNSFTDLAPGTYYVAVKNAAGDAVVYPVVIEQGAISVDKVYHSRNPISLTKAAAPDWETELNYRLYNDVRVEDVADSGNYASKLKMDLFPASNGQVTFYLPAAFHDAFTFVPPSLNETEIIRLTDRVKRFKNYTGQLIETETTPAELTASQPNLVIYGGVSKFHFPTLDYFGTYLPANKKFLTWSPVEKYVDRGQEDYLNFFCYENFVTLKLKLKVYFDDATDETAIVKEKVGTNYSELYQIPAGPANSGALLVNPAKNVTRYELSLLNQVDEVISEVRTYHINTLTHPLTRYFMILNSLGAFEVLTFKGRAEQTTSFTREVVQKFLPHDYSALDGEFAAHVVSRQRSKSFSSGYIKDKLAEQWHEYMEEFLGTPILYDITDGSRYPMVITAGDLDRIDQNYERFIRVTARDAYEDVSFTPRSV